MKQIFTKIVSFTLAILVLLSTFSFTVDKHYCGDFLVDVSFMGDADDCGTESEKIVFKKSCCKDEIHQIEGQDELQQASVDDFNLDKQQFLAAFYISYNDLFVENESQKNDYINFSPPEIPCNYQVLYQSFLI